jgi:hypothetical protein
VIHRFADRGPLPDLYLGGAGRDTLRLEFDAGFWGDPANREAAAALARWIEGRPGEEASLADARLGLSVSGFEVLAVTVDGVAPAPGWSDDWFA